MGAADLDGLIARIPSPATFADDPFDLGAECGFKIPPVQRWNPTACMDIGLRISADGRWHCHGGVITRRRLVKLFGSVLRLDANQHYLVTPPMKYPVAVEDAPFYAVEVRRQGTGAAQNLLFRTNLDDVVPLNRAHPITMRAPPASPHASPHPLPYLAVRGGLQAKLSRPLYYELAQMLAPAPTASSAATQAESQTCAESAAEFSPESDPKSAPMLGLYSDGEFFAFGRGV